jgi:chromosome segregation ATPase
MARSLEERERRLSERERAVAAAEAEANRLLADARAAHRTADRARTRARKLGARIARSFQSSLETGRARLDADRSALEEKIAKWNEARSEFHAAVAAERDRRTAAWADLAAQRKRLTAEWDETNRFHTEQAAVLAARETDLAMRESAAQVERARIQREVAALREEAATLDARARNSRQLLEELEQQRTTLSAVLPAPAIGSAPSVELSVALNRAADRDLQALATELEQREERVRLERAAVHALFATVSRDNAELADRRRVLTEQFIQLAAARAQWQEAERATVAEMEQLARTLRRRETDLDAREVRLTRADARRREDGYDLWQLRLRLEAWQSKLVAHEMRWHTERAEMEAEFNQRATMIAQRELQLPHAQPESEEAEPIPLALVAAEPDSPPLPSELAALRDELDRMAAVLLEADLPDLPDPPETELPWGAEDLPQRMADDIPIAFPIEEDGAELLLFESPAHAA